MYIYTGIIQLLFTIYSTYMSRVVMNSIVTIVTMVTNALKIVSLYIYIYIYIYIFT